MTGLEFALVLAIVIVLLMLWSFYTFINSFTSQIVYIYSNGCGHCTRFSPKVRGAFKTVKKIQNNIVSMPASEDIQTRNTQLKIVNMRLRELCFDKPNDLWEIEKYGVRSVPAVLRVCPDGSFEQYEGPRTEQDLLQWIMTV